MKASYRDFILGITLTISVILGYDKYQNVQMAKNQKPINNKIIFFKSQQENIKHKIVFFKKKLINIKSNTVIRKESRTKISVEND